MFLRKIIRILIPTSIRSWLYSLLDRWSDFKRFFWKTLRQKFPTFYYFFQALVTKFYLSRLKNKSPETYRLLLEANLPERLFRTIVFRLALVKTWKKFPVLQKPPELNTDVLFVSYSAHPDLVKMCIALKRSRPGIRCTLIASRHAHTQELCKKWFDEVIITGKGNDLVMLSALQHARAKVVVMRFREIVFHIMARLYCKAPLIYYPPGFFLSSRSEDFLADPELSMEEVFEADKYLLEHVQGVMHFLSNDIIDWFKKKGAKITYPAGPIYTACLAEQIPGQFLPKLSDQDGEWHLVHATGVETIFLDPRMGGGAFLPVEKCRVVTGQGIHLHVYGTYFDPKAPGYAPYVELARQSKYFHIEKNMEFDKLQVELTKYDFAWKHWDERRIALRPESRNHITPNFYAYIQSGLPLLMSPEMPPLELKTALEHGLGIVVDEDQLPNLKMILDGKKQEIKALADLIPDKANQQFCYDLDGLLAVIGPFL